MKELIFKNGDIIEWKEEGFYECVCADNVHAVFAPCVFMFELEDVNRHTDFRAMFIVSNTDKQAIESNYKIVAL